MGEFLFLFLDISQKTKRDSDLFEQKLVGTPLLFFECNPNCRKLSDLIKLILYDWDSLSNDNSSHTEETFQNYSQTTLLAMEKLWNESLRTISSPLSRLPFHSEKMEVKRRSATGKIFSKFARMSIQSLQVLQ